MTTPKYRIGDTVRLRVFDREKLNLSPTWIVENYVLCDITSPTFERSLQYAYNLIALTLLDQNAERIRLSVISEDLLVKEYVTGMRFADIPERGKKVTFDEGDHVIYKGSHWVVAEVMHVGRQEEELYTLVHPKVAGVRADGFCRLVPGKALARWVGEKVEFSEGDIVSVEGVVRSTTYQNGLLPVDLSGEDSSGKCVYFKPSRLTLVKKADKRQIGSFWRDGVGSYYIYLGSDDYFMTNTNNAPGSIVTLSLSSLESKRYTLSGITREQYEKYVKALQG